MRLTKMVFGSTVGVIANALPISGIGNWGTLEAGWAAGFLIVGLSKEKAITTGFGIHIVIFIVCALISFFCWVTPQKQKNPSPSALQKNSEEKGFNSNGHQRLMILAKPFGSHFASTPLRGSI